MKRLNQINRLIKKDLYERPRVAKGNSAAAKTLLVVLGFLFLISGSAFYYFFLSVQSPEIQTNKTSQKIITQILPLNLLSRAEDEEINILILGRPGAGYPGENLTDTIILIHFKPAPEKLILISLPRDLLIKIPKSQNYIKINNLYNLGGIQLVKQKTEEITGLRVNSYILADLVAVKEIVNLVDGLNIPVPQDINDPFFPGPNYSYQAFTLMAGWRYLDGETALKYIRTRYTSPNSDFDRMTRQQQILKALKQKVLSLNPWRDFPAYLKIFQSLNKHIQTDLGLMEIKSLWQTASKIGAPQITSLVIDKKETNLLTSGPVILNGQTASMVWPKAGRENYSEIRELIQKTVKDAKGIPEIIK